MVATPSFKPLGKINQQAPLSVCLSGITQRGCKGHPVPKGELEHAVSMIARPVLTSCCDEGLNGIEGLIAHDHARSDFAGPMTLGELDCHAFC